MAEKNANNHNTAADLKGTGFLFWGWIVVAVLNLGMVAVSLAIFAP